MADTMTVPGFVDLQVNGYRGVDFSSAGLTPEAFVRACRDLLGQGTVAFLPTIITCPPEVMERNLALVAEEMARPEFEGRLLGIHLEGPFLSRTPGAVGAHPPEHGRDPDPALLDRFLECARGRLRLLTIAADAPRADDLARHAVRRGVTVALGHHLATGEDLARLAEAGATLLTHLGNGVPAVLPRHANPIWAGLAEDRLGATLITDGHHLPASVIKVMLRAKGVGRVAVVSDAAPLAGMPPGRYHALGNDVVLEETGLLHVPSKGCLAGSSATMLECMNHLAGLGLLGLEELEAVGFHNPLAMVGLSPGKVRAEPQVGYDAARRRFFLLP